MSSVVTRTIRTRTRSKSLAGKKTVTTALGQNLPSTRTLSWSDSITDYHGRPPTDSSLSSTQLRWELTANGSAVSASGYGTVHYCVTFDRWPLAFAGLFTETPLPPPDGWYLDAIARSNPSRPVLTPPTLVQDIVEIPKMLRDLGKLLNKPRKLMSANEQASFYLAIQFGWLPLVQDIRQLLDLQSYILRKDKELNDLYSGKGLRRKLTFGSDCTVKEAVEAVSSYGTTNYMYFPLSVMVTKNSWATIRWTPTSPPKYGHGNDESQNQYARRIVLGLTPEGLAKGAWDVVPWTWLIGWFTNVGSYALAHSNTVPASHGSACFMSEVDHLVMPQQPYTRDMLDAHLSISGSAKRTLKTRIVSGSVTPGFNMPYLDMFRLSILGALSIQRYKRWWTPGRGFG